MAASTDRPRSTPIAPGETGKLTSRLRTSALYVPILLLAAWPGGWVFAGFVSLVSVMGLLELHGITARLGRPSYRPVSVLAGAALPLALHAGGLTREWVWPILAIVVVALLVRHRTDRVGVVAMTVLAVAYVPLLLGHLVMLRDGRFTAGEAGLALVIYLFLATWACDTFAYLVGRAVGSHPLWPAVSPNKTVEGAIGGVVATLLVSVAAQRLFLDVVGVYDALGIGLVLSVLLQLGDLFESKLKRKAQVKDSSAILPGHGGILDRFDSMIFGAPALCFLLILLMGRP